MIALESPTFAMNTWSSTMSTAHAQVPDLSLITRWFCFMNSSSATLNPCFNANVGFEGKHSCCAT